MMLLRVFSKLFCVVRSHIYYLNLQWYISFQGEMLSFWSCAWYCNFFPCFSPNLGRFMRLATKKMILWKCFLHSSHCSLCTERKGEVFTQFCYSPLPHFLCPLSLSSCLSNKLRITLDSIVGKTFEKFSLVAFQLIFTPFWRACNMKIEAWRRWHHLTHIEHHSRQGSRASECTTLWPFKVFKTPNSPHIPQNSPSPISSQIGFVQYWPTDPLSPDDGFCVPTNSSDRITFHFFCQNMSLFNGSWYQSLILKNLMHKT